MNLLDIIKNHPIVAVWFNSSLCKSTPDFLELATCMVDAYEISSDELDVLANQRERVATRCRRVSSRIAPGMTGVRPTSV